MLCLLLCSRSKTKNVQLFGKNKNKNYYESSTTAVPLTEVRSVSPPFEEEKKKDLEDSREAETFSPKPVPEVEG